MAGLEMLTISSSATLAPLFNSLNAHFLGIYLGHHLILIDTATVGDSNSIVKICSFTLSTADLQYVDEFSNTLQQTFRNQIISK